MYGTGTIYYYYDKALVTNFKLRNLYPYVGKVKRDAVVQLVVYPASSKKNPLSAPAGISMAGDFYTAVLPGGITYQIHKDGKMIRAYTPDISLVERTLKGIPMAILAMIEGKLLLHSSIAIIRDAAYVFIGETEMGRAYGLFMDKTVLLSDNGTAYKAARASFPGFEASQILDPIESPTLKGICVLHYGSKRAKAISIISSQTKKNLLLENYVGYQILPPQLKQKLYFGKAINQASRVIPMKYIAVPEGFEKQDQARRKIYKMMKKRSSIEGGKCR